MRKLVLGTVHDYEFANLKAFLYSLRKTGYDGEIVFYVRVVDDATRKALREFGVELLELDTDHTLSRIPVNTARYFVYNSFLADYGHRFDAVMLSDVRDVFFQKDPLDFDIGGALCCFLEDAGMTLATCRLNSEWITTAFGRETLDQIGHNSISCSGTTIGARDAVQDYLQKMVEGVLELSEREPAVVMSRPPMDQAIHNRLLYTGRLPRARVFDNEHGPVMTLGHKKPETLNLNENERVINESGEEVRVLHQYDRYIPLLYKVLGEVSTD